jgi:hypothetical protein
MGEQRRLSWPMNHPPQESRRHVDVRPPPRHGLADHLASAAGALATEEDDGAGMTAQRTPWWWRRRGRGGGATVAGRSGRRTEQDKRKRSGWERKTEASGGLDACLAVLVSFVSS